MRIPSFLEMVADLRYVNMVNMQPDMMMKTVRPIKAGSIARGSRSLGNMDEDVGDMRWMEIKKVVSL